MKDFEGKIIVAVDMDGVLVDLSSFILECMNEDFGTNHTKDDIKKFYFQDDFPPIPGGVIRRYFKQAGAFGPDRRSIEGAVAGMRYLRTQNNVKVLIVTSPLIGHDTCEMEKRAWIRHHLPWFRQKDVIFTTHKSLVAADVLVDDKSKNIEEFVNRNEGVGVLFDQPYNRDFDNDDDTPGRVVRAKGWDEVLDAIEDLQKQRSNRS